MLIFYQKWFQWNHKLFIIFKQSTIGSKLHANKISQVGFLDNQIRPAICSSSDQFDYRYIIWCVNIPIMIIKLIKRQSICVIIVFYYSTLITVCKKMLSNHAWNMSSWDTHDKHESILHGRWTPDIRDNSQVPAPVHRTLSLHVQGWTS